MLNRFVCVARGDIGIVEFSQAGAWRAGCSVLKTRHVCVLLAKDDDNFGHPSFVGRLRILEESQFAHGLAGGAPNLRNARAKCLEAPRPPPPPARRAQGPARYFPHDGVGTRRWRRVSPGARSRWLSAPVDQHGEEKRRSAVGGPGMACAALDHDLPRFQPRFAVVEDERGLA